MNPPIHKKAAFECRRLPEILDEFCSTDGMKYCSELFRNQLREAVLNADNPDSKPGMTCIAQEDIPEVTGMIHQGINERYFEHDQNLRFRNRFFEKLRELNRPCYECLRQDCENQVALDRLQVLELTLDQGPQDLRKLKVDPRFASKGLKPSYDY